MALKQKWSDGPRTYLGLAVAGFPNLFTVTGPGSPSVLSNMMNSLEQHIEWIADCIELTWAEHADRQHRGDRRGRRRVDATTSMTRPTKTLFFQSNTWYVGANIPGKPRVIYPYVGGVGVYRGICDEIAAKGYEGFTLGGASGRLIATGIPIAGASRGCGRNAH